MSFSLPNPTVPTNGQPGDATPILANEIALAQAIAAFDGSQINAKSVVEAALADPVNPRLRGLETLANFVYVGCIWTQVSGVSGTMTGGTIYVNGYRTIVSGIGSNTFAASSDTYVYIDYLGNVTYSAVSNNASSPSAIANAILVAIIVTSGAAITTINQGSPTVTAPQVSSAYLSVCDSLGNLIYPTDPVSRVLGYRQLTSSPTTTSASAAQISAGLTLPIITPANRKVKITIYCYYVSNSGANTNTISLWLGTVGSGTQLQINQNQTAVNNTGSACTLQFSYIPATTTPTYNVGASTTAGTLTFNGASTAPSYILAELE